MELFELMGSLLPVLMIILFIIISIKKAVGKKSENRDRQGSSRQKIIQDRKSELQKRLKPWLERFPEMAEMISGTETQLQKPAIEPLAAPLPGIEPVLPPTAPESLNILGSSSTYMTSREETGPNHAKERLSRLPNLQKAVIWAEILGKPKGLE